MGLFSSNAPRREHSRKDLALRGVIGMAVTAVVLALLSLLALGTFSGAPRVTATLDDVGASLFNGADVKVRGAIVGKVSGFEANDETAILELTIDSDQIKGIPDNVVARVLPATVFGTSYVDLVVNEQPGAGRLQDGDVVRQDDSQATLEFQQALDDIDGLVKALGPADLNVALSAVAQALDGRGEQIGETIDLANSLLGRYNQEFPRARRTLSLLATNMEIVRENAPELLQAVSDGLVTASTIVDQQGQITALLTAGLALARDAGQFIDRRGTSLVQAIRQAETVVDATFDNRQSGIVEAFRANTLASSRFPSAIQNGQVVLQGNVQTDAPPYYSAGDCPTYGSLRGNC